MVSEVANQLKSQSFDEVLSSAFKQVGGRVFPDLLASQSVSDLVAIVDGFRATHLLSYGNAIPNTGTAYIATPASTDTPVDLVAPADNECIIVNAVSLENIDGSAIEYTMHLGTTLVSIGAVPANVAIPVELNRPLYLSKGQTLTITATSGTANRLNASASGVKSCL